MSQIENVFYAGPRGKTTFILILEIPDIWQHNLSVQQQHESHES